MIDIRDRQSDLPENLYIKQLSTGFPYLLGTYTSMDASPGRTRGGCSIQIYKPKWEGSTDDTNLIRGSITFTSD